MKKVISLFLAIAMLVGVLSVSFTAVTLDDAIAATSDYEDITLEPNKLYFDVNGTGWTMGSKDKVAFHIFGGDLTNGLVWGAKKAQGTATSGADGIWEIDPAAKLGLTLNEGVQYKIIFTKSSSNSWVAQTFDLFFTTDCLGHVAYCNGTQYENPVDSSKITTAAFWYDMDASVNGPCLAVTSIGNVVGTCPAIGTTPLDVFVDFCTVAKDDFQGKTGLENARYYTVEQAKTKTEQEMIDDIGADLGLTKAEVAEVFATSGVETAWVAADSTLPEGAEPTEAPHVHTPAEPVQENVVPATCQEEGSYDEVVYCSECGEELSREAKTIEKLNHTPGEAVRENEVPATCQAEGSYDEVVYCTECNTELSRETKTIDKLNHTPGEAVRENEKPATCSAEGSYDEVVYCTECNTELSRETKTIDKLNHTPGEAVRENEKPATCSAEGSYDEVIYCTECKEELSRETKTIDKIAHTPGEAVRENEVVGHDSTTYDSVVYCTVCNEEISRTPASAPIITHTLTYVAEVPATEDAEGTRAHYTCSGCDKLFADAEGTQEVTAADLVIPKLDHVHTPGETVRENEVPATCTAAGSYDEVVYCTACGAELSRETKTIDKLAHDLTYVAEVPATEEAEGTAAHYVCSSCNKLFADETGSVEVTAADLVIPKLAHTHTPGEAVQENVVPASCEAEGSYDEVVYCTVCGEEISREHKTIDKTKHTLKRVNGKPATETEDGWLSHYKCSVCGKLFADPAGTREVTWEQVVKPATGTPTEPPATEPPATEPPTDPPVVITGILGDVDGSGDVDIIDVTMLQRVLANMKTADEAMTKRGDVDKNGSLETIDATRIQRFLLGIDDKLGIGADV